MATHPDATTAIRETISIKQTNERFRPQWPNASSIIRKIKKKLIILTRLTTLISLFQHFKSF
jgi:hypothetical protein